MRRILIGLLVVVLAAVAFGVWSFIPPAALLPAADGSFRLTGVHLVEPGMRWIPDAELEIRDGLFASVAPATADAESDFEDLRGSYVLPGLMDLHTHLPTDSPLALTRYFGLLYLAHGVTTVRDAGDLDGTAVPAALRDFEDKGHAGPRTLACGPFVAGPGSRWANSVIVERPDQAEGVIRDLVDGGFSCIKLYDGLDVPRIEALVAAANEAGLAVIGHVPHGLSLEEARVPNTQHLMGIASESAAADDIIHRIMDWSSVDDARIDEVVRASRALSLAHTPTLVSGHELLRYRDYEAARASDMAKLLPRLYRDVAWSPVIGIAAYRDLTPEALELFSDAVDKKLGMTRRLHLGGVELRIGTDAQQPFVPPGASVWTEMRLWEQAGIPADEIWAYATWKGGADTPLPDLGRLVEGAPADFLVFADDPTTSLDALDSLQAVVVRGRLYRRADLAEAIDAYRDFYESWLIDQLSVQIAKSRLASTAAD